MKRAVIALLLLAAAFGMSPFTLPNGDTMDEKLYKASYGRLYLGFAVYF